MTEIVVCTGTSRMREGETNVTNTAHPTIAAQLSDLDDTALVAHTREAWIAALTRNEFDEIRACQGEALRRGKPHLYDQGYIEFWLGTAGPAPEAA